MCMNLHSGEGVRFLTDKTDSDNKTTHHDHLENFFFNDSD